MFKQKAINCVLIISSCVGFLILLNFVTHDIFNALNNFIIIPVFFAFSYFYLHKKWHTQTHQLSIWIFSFIISMIAVLGYQLESYSNIVWNITTIFKILSITATFFPVVYFSTDIIKKISKSKEFIVTKKQKIITFSTIFIIGFIVWILFYPGIYTYDMAAQNEMISQGIFTSHWSLTYGTILNAFLNFGNRLFNSYNIGFAIFTLLQLLFISYVSFKIVIFATNITKNKYIYIVSLLFFCFVPFLPVLAITDAQDVIFGGLFALIIIELFNMIYDKSFFSKKISIVKFIILAFLMTTIRNNGVYCLLFMIPFIFFLKDRNKWKILLTVSIPVVCSFIYSGPIFNMLHIQKTTATNEILGIPSQQLARSYVYNKNSFSDEEKQKIEKYYKIDKDFLSYENYPLISDFTKKSLKNDAVLSNPIDYLSLWTSIGIKNTGNYIEAFLLNSFGFWYPLKNYNDDRIKLDYMNYPGFSMTSAFESSEHSSMKRVERQIPDNKLTQLLDKIIFGNGWSFIPIISQASAMGNYFIILIGCFCTVCAKKRYKFFIIILPIIGLMLTLLLAPVAIYRYIYPIALSVPILISYMIFIIKDKNKSKKERTI